jgi:hypothetical protein
MFNILLNSLAQGGISQSNFELNSTITEAHLITTSLQPSDGLSEISLNHVYNSDLL